MTASQERVKGSYRDPSGYVYLIEDVVYRTVNPAYEKTYEWIKENGIFEKSHKNGFLIETEELRDNIPDQLVDACYVLKHRRIEHLSWPYEWSFFQLKDAALLHLDFQLFLLDKNAVLVDASAYNIQFIGKKPIFIDALSIRPYKDGEYWTAYKQFCDHFLNPLLLRSVKGIPHNGIFRGNMEGVATRELNSILSLFEKMSVNMLMHVVLPAQLEEKSLENPHKAIDKAKKGRGLSKSGYRGLLGQLRRWIAKLEPRGFKKSVWGNYEQDHSYLPEEVKRKTEAIADFCKRYKPVKLMDIGCNTGFYSKAALQGGAQYVIGYDFDQKAIEYSYTRDEFPDQFLPLLFDAANPSPSQGWMQSEREGFIERANADALIALAFEHHLAIGKNIPLPQVVDWLLSIAPRGLIEFVPKEDDMVKRLLAIREDIFQDYSIDTFIREIESRARVINSTQLTESGRVLIEYHCSE